MFSDKPKNSDAQNKFIKYDSDMLNHIYKTEEVTPYWVADMDFPIANPITLELQRLVDREVYAYEFNSSAVFKAISDWNKRQHNIELNPKTFVQVPGVLNAIALLIREWSEVGDGVLIQTPVYHQFKRLIESSGRKAINNTMKIEDGHYRMDFDDFEEKLKSGNVKMVLLCNPHNPVGRVWTKSELQKLVDIAKKYDVVIISDEIHADIVFSGHKFTSIVEFGYEKSVSIIGSPAKNFGLNSISNGYIYTDNQEMFEQIKSTVNSLSLDHGNAFTTFATIAAYEKGQTWFDGFLAYTENTVNWVVDFIENNLPQILVYKPEGTNQIWFDFSGVNLDEEALKELIVTKAKMGLTPGSWFGEPNANFYRMNIASPLGQIQASFLLLKSEIDKLNS